MKEIITKYNPPLIKYAIEQDCINDKISIRELKVLSKTVHNDHIYYYIEDDGKTMKIYEEAFNTKTFVTKKEGLDSLRKHIEQNIIDCEQTIESCKEEMKNNRNSLKQITKLENKK